MIIGVDIDGTLTVETEGWDYKNRTPRFDIIQKINKLYAKGNTIILFTSRYKEDDWVTQKWLITNGVLFHKIIFDKPKFDIYIGEETKRPEEL